MGDGRRALPELGPDADRRTVLHGGGRALVWEGGETQPAIEEALDERWRITRRVIRDDWWGPSEGDIVFWRGGQPGDELSAPTRVIHTEPPGADGDVRVVCLEDAALQRVPSTDGTGTDPDDALDADETRIAPTPDRELDARELWTLLLAWDLHPLCARCGGEMRPRLIRYGLVSPDALPDDPDIELGGCCVPGPEDFSTGLPRRCTACGHRLD